MKLHINKKLLPMKGHYFLYNAGVAPVQPFMPVIAESLNFPPNAVGIIFGILPFTGMLAKPLFGAVADRFRLHRFIFICFQIITIIGFFNVQFLSRIEKRNDSEVKLVCGAETNFDICFENPEKLSSCLVKDVLRESNTNKTITCSLRCNLSIDFRTELCGPWKANPKICTEKIDSQSDVAEYTHVKDGLGGDNGSTEAQSTIDDAKLYFTASVPMKHTLKVANCLYFRVADAKLNDETHHIPYCEREVDTQCKIHCEDSKLSELLQMKKNEKSDVDFVHYYQFWVFLFLAIISWVGMAVVGSVADAVCFEVLGDQASQYGRQRLWGSVGWGTFAIITGLLIDQFSKNNQTDYTPAFYMMLIVIICDIFCAYILKYEQTKVSSDLFRNVGKLFKDIWIDMFLFWCIIVGMCVGVQWTFLFLHLNKLTGCDETGSGKTLLGLVSGFQCFLGELPSFFVFGIIIKKIGHIHMMTLIPCLIGIRFILYSILQSPWWTLPIELLQCSVGFSFATMASYASIVAPPGAEATVQGLVGAIFEGIGVSLGSYLGGIIYNKYGGPGLFQIFAIIAFALCLTHGTIHYLLARNSKLQTQTKDFNGVAKYAPPNEAVSMLEDTPLLSLEQ